MKFNAMLFGFVWAVLLVGGCAQKLPTPSLAEGLLVMPMQAVNTTTPRQFVLFYEFVNSSEPSPSLIIRPDAAADFWISPLLPQGNYSMDTLVLRSSNQYGVISSANKEEIPLDRPMTFSIQPGEITFMAGLLEVRQSMDDGETIRFQHNFRKMTDAEYEDYLGRFLSLENSGGWKISDNK